MILDLIKLQEKYHLDIRGVLHIGAHYGEENKVYDGLGIQHRVFVEPIESNFGRLLERTSGNPNIKYFNTALGNFVGVTQMWTSSNDNTSASVLKPKNHLQLHPHVKFGEKIEVKMDKLDNLDIDKTNYNFINIDVQGYELEVFKGGMETLEGIDYIMAEINRDEVYEDCPHIDELKDFLSPYGFQLVEWDWAGRQWGDGFFIKTKE